MSYPCSTSSGQQKSLLDHAWGTDQYLAPDNCVRGKAWWLRCLETDPASHFQKPPRKHWQKHEAVCVPSCSFGRFLPLLGYRLTKLRTSSSSGWEAAMGALCLDVDLNALMLFRWLSSGKGVGYLSTGLVSLKPCYVYSITSWIQTFFKIKALKKIKSKSIKMAKPNKTNPQRGIILVN